MDLLQLGTPDVPLIVGHKVLSRAFRRGNTYTDVFSNVDAEREVQ